MASSPIADDRQECTCGWPKQPCLRKVLSNGPPYPPEPCEPKQKPNG